MIIVIVLLAFTIGYIIYQRKEIKRLNKCWEDLFNHKLDGENRWHDLCCHYLERITELQTENELLKQKVGNKKKKQNKRM